MRLTSKNAYHGHALCKTPDTEVTSGWWFVPDLRMHLKLHQRWRAEIWLPADSLHLARLQIYDHFSGAEWLDASYPPDTSGVVPFQRADRFMLDGRMPGWGEWPSEPTSNGRVPMLACLYCHSPVSRTEVVVIGPGPVLGRIYPVLTVRAPRAHRSCHRSHQRKQSTADHPQP
ncbi:hypothetical protein SAMN04489712_105495 [Thermomonospora echinospora]|uniref:Uncharacterized protein n=1 Tax=Thermomonospora echinospora TaxID=1992 RepID=A0A1H6AL57_9ACTN|nr:hypothetical protein [Thermomonospora echinospora]SEG48765.1 hypothetical protein SAMN04489712_105495 [Thermomonospora echinospora]